MSDNVAHALSGAGGGVVSMVLTYPLITISSRLQVQKNMTDDDAYKRPWFCPLWHLCHERCYCRTPIAHSYCVYAPRSRSTTGIYYYFYEWVKAAFEKAAKEKRGMSTSESMIAGAIAGAAVVFCTNPIWTVNTRMTTRKQSLDASNAEPQKVRQAPTTVETALSILREEGFQGFYAGVKPALVLVMNPIIQYTVFEQLKARLARTKKLGNMDFFLLGAISKLAATSITYPYIVIKSRMQLKQSDTSPSSSRYTSIWDGFTKIIQHEGWGGLYKGISSKLVQSVLTSAFLFMAKEALFEWAVYVLVIIGARRPARRVKGVTMPV
ncbi:mitochondrial carrier domain-containing protein [Jimgerdemannia flammicorona]|uniref:Mitochondrial carrier domain-containing protein n=1 Tax=Jimgerdemannia flammicorona TaxID=994334 RepID=A0A433QD23_9FUNG|nr:mitochondrial carrier domain-containing protein [Jimgerdemannia flammicorona]